MNPKYEKVFITSGMWRGGGKKITLPTSEGHKTENLFFANILN